MPAPAPFFSIIVVCKNPGPRLLTAIDSIWAQAGESPELIVVDGASTDGTREWLELNRARIATLITGPDAGVYDAMNKGIAAARGEWIFFLGADDRFASERVLSEARGLMENSSAGVVVGEAAYEDGRIYRLPRRIRPLARNFVHHQAAFYRRQVFVETGAFDPSLRIAADYDFNLRLWQQHVRFKSIDLRVAACGIGGLSDGGAWRVYREEIAVRHRHAPAWRCWFWDALSLARFARKQIVRLVRHRLKSTAAAA